jgi:hypothetical protein
MSITGAVGTDHQLARLLQIGIVLEEVVEARAHKHAQTMNTELDEEVMSLLEEAAEESAEHRTELEGLVDELEADPVPFDQIETLVEAQYGKTKPEDFDGVLYDQLCNEETAYKFYDDVITAIKASDASFSIDRARLISTLSRIRAEEAEGAEEVTTMMENR